MAESKVYEFNTLFFWDLFSVSDLTKVYLASTVTAIIETQVSARFQHLVEWRVLEVKKHMVKCYENAYRPKNLSLFAFNIDGYWGQIKKKLKETKSQMFLSMSLHLWKCFVLLQGVQKIYQIIVFFSSIYWVKLSPKKDNHKMLRLKKENNYSTIFWTPCKKAEHFQRCKGIDENIWFFVSINFFFIWPQ